MTAAGAIPAKIRSCAWTTSHTPRARRVLTGPPASWPHRSAGNYLEVVEVLDHPAADKVPFGQAVRARTEAGGGWLGWVVAVDDLRPIEARLGRRAVDGNRRRPDGYELRWKQIG